MKREAKRPLLVCTVILAFLSIFTNYQEWTPFEAQNSAHLSRYQRNVRFPVQNRQRHRAFSRVSTGDSDIPSSCEMKDVPSFKPLQGNLTFRVRATRGPFHLRQKTQSSSHIPIAEGRLLLRSLWKVGLTLQSKTGNHPHSEMIWGAWNFPQVAVLKLMILYTWDGCLRESLEIPKWSQATCSVWCGSRAGYGANAREIGLISIWFGVHWVILHSWGDISVLPILWQWSWGLFGVQSSKLRPLRVSLGKPNCSACNARESGLISRGVKRLIGFLELRHKPGIYPRVTAGMSIWN